MKYNQDTPILFIIFNRPNTTVRVFEQIRKQQPRRLYLAADGARNDIEWLQCNAVRDIVLQVDWECDVKSVFQDDNLGCRKHCIQAIRWFFENETEGIVLEDDCLPSDSFFGFCSTLLEKYRDDQRIAHISGGNYQNNEKRGDGSYYFSSLTHVWGWASWKRVWCEYDINMTSFSKFRKTNYLSNMPSHGPYDYYWQHYFAISSNPHTNGWDFQYAYLNLINNRLSIIPNVNLVSNIGCADNATHLLEDHPFSAIPLYEVETMEHPSFVIPDIEADLTSQAMELKLSRSLISDDYQYIRDRLQSVTDITIPKIIHQIYEDPAGPPDYLKNVSETWQKFNPDWEYRFWNKSDIENFLEKEFPDYIARYKSFPYDVQRWDVIRYLILFRYGGLYVDMDYECTEPITPLFCGTNCAMGLEPKGHATRSRRDYIVGNAFMASIPNHSYFAMLIKESFEGELDSGNFSPGKFIVESTGPFMTTRVYDNLENKDIVTLIPSELVAPLSENEVRLLLASDSNPTLFEMKVDKCYAIHYFLGSWYDQFSN